MLGRRGVSRGGDRGGQVGAAVRHRGTGRWHEGASSLEARLPGEQGELARAAPGPPRSRAGGALAGHRGWRARAVGGAR